MYRVYLNNVCKIYGKGNNQVKALDNVSVRIEDNKFTAIIGKSGSGKSTLINMISGLDYPDKGTVTVGDIEISSLSENEKIIFRRKNIGVIFQNYNLLPELNVYENIILPIALDKKKIDEYFLSKVLLQLDINEKMYEYPNNLSGGEQQRIAIARALLSKPQIIIADEPTGNLDGDNSANVIHLLKTICKEFKQTVIIVTHDLEIAYGADAVIKLKDGKIVDNIRSNGNEN